MPRAKSPCRMLSDRLADRLQIEVEDRLFLLALFEIALAQRDDLAQHLDVVAVALGLGIDLLDVVGDRLLLFLEALDALHDALELIALNRIVHLISFRGYENFGRSVRPDRGRASSRKAFALNRPDAAPAPVVTLSGRSGQKYD